MGYFGPPWGFGFRLFGRDDTERMSRANSPLLRKRARRRLVQGERVDLVAGARVDLRHDRIVTRDETIGMAGQALDRLPGSDHVADVVDDRKRAAALQVRI